MITKEASIDRKSVYIGLFPYESEDGKIVDPFKERFKSWFPYDNKTTWIIESQLVFGHGYWTLQFCLPREQRNQQLLPWAKQRYFQVMHLAWSRPFGYPPLRGECLCVRWPIPHRYSEKLGLEYVVYLHRVGECPCMEYSSL